MWHCLNVQPPKHSQNGAAFSNLTEVSVKQSQHFTNCVSEYSHQLLLYTTVCWPPDLRGKTPPTLAVPCQRHIMATREPSCVWSMCITCSRTTSIISWQQVTHNERCHVFTEWWRNSLYRRNGSSTHRVNSLFGSVFRWDQRQTKRLNFGLSPELRLTNHCSASSLTSSATNH